MRLGVVLLAAGMSSRFGGNKLLARLGGRRVIDYAADAALSVDCQRRAAVVSSEDVAGALRRSGFDILYNREPGRGMASSIVIGVRAMEDMDAVLLLAADQPLLQGRTLARLVDAFIRSGKGIACLRDGTHWGNPAIFSRIYLNELAALAGDKGAKAVIRRHEDDLVIVDCTNADELADADTPELLRHIEEKIAR